MIRRSIGRKGKPVKEAEGPFSVAKGVLRANADLYWELLEEFDMACAHLLQTPKARVEVDLTQVNFISSSFVGCLGNLLLRASRLRKRVSIRVTLDVSWLFEIMGRPKTLELQIV